MYNFPTNLYCDLRIEDRFQTSIRYELGKFEEVKEKSEKGAFIRIFDGTRWYYSSTTDIENIQQEINDLAKLATANDSIGQHPVVAKLEVNKGEFLRFDSSSVKNVEIKEKISLVKDYSQLFEEYKDLSHWKVTYIDWNVQKSFFSSKGADLKFDSQISGLSLSYRFGTGTDIFADAVNITSETFAEHLSKKEQARKELQEGKEFFDNAEVIEGGNYTVVLSPMAAGVFAHESFGHKSEADFMLGDEKMKQEWAIGTRVGADLLTITDNGNNFGSGYVPFDDEGSKAQNTYLIKDGILSGRLHNAITAVDLEENLTGNARAMSFEYEPIVRMTSTCIGKGDRSKEEIIAEINEGILIETIKHGSGMSTFTIAPARAYLIKNGKIEKPVKFSVITGNVMSTLNEIDAISNESKIESFVTGGCGKMEQWPLPVSFGGPYVRIKKINVQ